MLLSPPFNPLSPLLISWGHFSTVWLVHDTQCVPHSFPFFVLLFTPISQFRYSALKVVKSASRYADTARDEIQLLTKVSDASPAHPGRAYIVSFLDSFTHPGPENHICIVFEPLGENLLALIERNKKKGVPQPLVKLITKQILLGLQYLHDECNLVHTDIKPENIRMFTLSIPCISLCSFTVISIPDIEAHILAELSVSPSPRSRQVGVPHPTRSRLGMTIPSRRPPARERHVEIFDSQPLSSPSSRCGSIGASASSPSLHNHFLSAVPPLGTSSTNRPQEHPASPCPQIVSIDKPSGSPSTVSTTSSFSMHGGTHSILSTPPTSVESADIPALSKMTSITISDPPLHSKEKSQPEPPPSPLIQSHPPNDIPHAPIGPSLLSRTAPQRTNSSTPSHSSTTTSTACPTPQPPQSPIGYTPLTIKIADLGNATPTNQHYTEDIQTRQYRAPEAILGRRDWGTRADIWSVACVVFELLTAEFLFDPHGQGELFTKDDDHMAQIIELMGDFPLEAKMGGRYSRELFDHTGQSFNHAVELLSDAVVQVH